MGNEMSRRNFLRATAGVAGAVALGMAGTAVAEEEKHPEFEGKRKFAGVRNVRYVTDDLVYLGASDRRLALFENVYPIPRGVSYNSYLLLDEKTVLFDTVDRSVSGQFFENLEYALDGNLFADERPFEKDWLDDARRYYCNIVGKYGPQVQAVLAKAATVEIATICPLHGPIWRENLGWIIDKYDKWSSYTPEDPQGVMVVYGSVYGGTESAANVVASRLSEGGVANVRVYDVSRTHVSELIAEAFRCSHIVFASMTYNMDVFTPMKNFITDLAAHNLQNRKYALIENGSWSPVAGSRMKEKLDAMSGMEQVGQTVTILSAPNDETYAALSALADAVLASLSGKEEAPVEAAPAAATKWVCTVCGYIYEGDTVPEDYKCPVCGVGPEKFAKKE